MIWLSSPKGQVRSSIESVWTIPLLDEELVVLEAEVDETDEAGEELVESEEDVEETGEVDEDNWVLVLLDGIDVDEVVELRIAR